MPRLFVALRPPRAMRERLLAMMEGVSGARWQDDGQLHLTLRFIGDVQHRLAEDLAAALATVDGPCPAIALSGVGTFERRGRVHTLWAGIAADPALGILKDRIDRALERAGLPPERRTFRPHITLARLGAGAGPVGAFLMRHGLLGSDPASVETMLLHECLLHPTGAEYPVAGRYPLVGRSAHMG